MQLQAYCYEGKNVDFIHAFYSGNTGMHKVSKLAETS